jgi:hypothetical protein
VGLVTRSRRVEVDRRRLTGKAWRVVCPVGSCGSVLARSEHATRGTLRAGFLTHLTCSHGYLTQAERSLLADSMVFDARLTDG